MESVLYGDEPSRYYNDVTDHNSQTQLNNDWKADDERTERYGDGNG